MAQELRTDVDSLPAQIVSVHVRETAPESWLAFDEAIFAALWQDGRDIGDREVLADIAADVDGLDPEIVDEALADDDLRDRVTDLFRAAGARSHRCPDVRVRRPRCRGAVPPEQLERLVGDV